MDKLLKYGLPVLAFIAAASSAFATDLGQALQFGALSTKNEVVLGKGSGSTGLIGGAGILMQKDSGSEGDLIASPLGINIQAGASAPNCITGGAKVRIANTASCTSTDTSGSNPELQTKSGAITDMANFVSEAGKQASTLSPGRIKIPTNQGLNIADTVPGLNVISTPSITIGTDGLLTFSGAANDSVLVQVAGNLIVGAGAALATRTTNDPLPQNQLLFLVSGGLVNIGHDAGVIATIVAPNATCILGHDAGFRGAFLCGKVVKVNANAGLELDATGVTVP